VNHPAGGQIVSLDRSTVEAVVQHYFDGVHEGDADKLEEIFHPSADLRSLEKGELQVLHLPAWLNWMRKRPSAKAEGKPRDDFIVTIDRSDDQTAFIKVRCQLPPRYFTDYLVAMKLKDGWKIVSKSYRYDLRG
jgi:Putative lumazine-binding